MEHIVQFGISIDDARITASIEANAEKQIVETITQEVRDKLFTNTYYNRHAKASDPLSDFTLGLVEDFLDKHKDAIIEKASVHLAEKLSRTKAAKALLLKGEGDEEK